MKLHLPLTLLAALLAVVTLQPVHAEDVSPINTNYEYTDGVLEGIDYRDYTFTVSDGETITMNNSQTAISGASDITLSGGGAFHMSAGTLGSSGSAVQVTIGSAVSGTDSVFNITGGTVASAGQVTFGVNSGGVLNVSGAMVGYGSGAVATIKVSGGTLNLKKDARLGEVSAKADIEVTGGGTVNVDALASIAARNVGHASITVTDGTFTTSGNVLSNACGGGSITVGKQGTFIQNGGIVAYGLMSAKEVAITVNGGSYVMRDGNLGTNMGVGSDKPLVAVSITDGGSFTQTSGSVGSFITNITFDVTGGSTYTLSGGYLGNASGTFNLTLSQGSTFELSGGATILGVIHIDVSKDSTFTQSGGTISGGYITIGAEGDEGDAPEGAAEDPQFAMTDGDILGKTSVELTGGTSFSMSGSAEIGGSAQIHVGSGSSFLQSGGSFGGSAALILDEGAAYTLSGGSYEAAELEASGAGSSITLSGSGSMSTDLTLSSGATFSQTGGTFTGSISGSGTGTSITQEEGSLTGDITLSEGATFTQSGSVTGGITVSGATYTQSGGVIGDGSSITLGTNGKFEQTGGSIFADVQLDDSTASFAQGGVLNGSITVNGGAHVTQSGSITGDVTVNNGYFEQQGATGSIGGSVVVDGAGSHFTQSGMISGDVTVRNGGNFRNNDASILGSLTVDNAAFNQAGNVGKNVTVQNGATLTQTDASAVISGDVTVGGTSAEGAQSSFTQLGSIEGGVTVTEGGKFTQQSSASIGGQVQVQGGAFDQAGSITGGVSLASGSFTQQSTGSTGGRVQVQGGTFSQAGSITGGVSLTGGSFTQQSTGSISGGVTVQGGSFNQSGSVTGAVEVTGGSYTLAAGAITGDVAVQGAAFTHTGGSVGGKVSLTEGAQYTVSGSGSELTGGLSIAGSSTFTMNEGAVSGAIDVESGSLIMNGGTVSDSVITVAAGGSATLGGSVESSASVNVTDGTLTLRSGATMAAAVTLSGASAVYNMGGVAAGGEVTMQGGKLANAGNFAGHIIIDTAADYTAAVNLGSAAAGQVTSITTRSADTLITGIGSGTLTLTGSNSMVVGSQTAGQGSAVGSGSYMINFADSGSSIAFGEGATMVLNFSMDLLTALHLEKGGEFYIYVANGSIDSRSTGKFVFGSGYEGFTIESISGGVLKVNATTLDNIWFASAPGHDEVDEENLTSFNGMSSVVMDADMTVSATGEATFHQIVGDGEKAGNLTIASSSGTVTFDNSNSNSQANGNTVYNGNITVDGTATLKKTGDATLTLGGVLTNAGMLDVQGGKLVLKSSGNTLGMLSMAGDTELSVEGDLTLLGISALNGGSITGGGSITQNGGSLDFGSATVAANVTVAGGGSVKQGGAITGDVLVEGNKSSFTQKADIFGSVTITGSGASYTGEGSGTQISGSVTISGDEVEMENAPDTIGRGVEISGAGSSMTGAKSVGGDITLSGDGASFAGIDAAVAGGVTLSGAGASASSIAGIAAGATVSGKNAELTADAITGAVIVSGEEAEVTANTSIEGDVSLTGAGASVTAAALTGNVELTGAGSTLTLSGASLTGNVTLNGDNASIDFGSQAINNSGSLTIFNGSLANAGSYSGDVYINTSASFSGDKLSLGGLNAVNVKNIKTATGLSLTGLTGTLTFSGSDNLLTVGAQHVGIGGASAQEALIQFDGDSGSVTFGDTAVKLQFTDALLHSFGSEALELWFTNGKITDIEGKSGDELVSWLKTHLLFATGSGLDYLVFTDATEQQKIKITAVTNNIWRTSEEETRVTSAAAFDPFSKVVIDQPTLMEVKAADGEDHSIIRQLEGNSTLTISNSGSKPLTIELRNESLYNSAGEQVTWGETTFNGDIAATGTVDFEKTGNDSLILNGSLSTPGKLSVTEGTLTLNGSGNMVDSIGNVAEDSSLVVNGMLTLTGAASSLSAGSITGSGAITVQSGTLTLSGDVILDGPALVVNGELGMHSPINQAPNISGLFGNGTIYIRGNELTISGGQGVFSGTLDVDQATLNITGTAQQTLIGAGAAGCALSVSSKAALILQADTAAYATVDNSGTLRIAPTGSGAEAAATGQVSVSDGIYLHAGAVTEFVLNFDSTQTPNASAPLLSTTAAAVLEAGQRIVVDGVGVGVTMPESLEIVLIRAEEGLYSSAATGFALEGDGDKLADGTMLTNVETRGLFNVYYEAEQAVIAGDGKEVVFTAGHRTTNLFAPAAVSYNSTAGSTLLWAARDTLDLVANPTLGQVIATVADLAHTGQMAKTSRALAAVAGSTVTALSAAQSDSLRQQLDRTRQHARLSLPTHAANSHTGHAKLQPHAWVEGIGTFAELSAEGDESGYKLNSWGGSVGADIAVSSHLTVGLSLTALYGDLDATAAETASGKLDAYYLSLFLRGTSGKWSHSVALVGGLTSAELDRSVNLGSFAYSTSGSTDGTSLGALYEVAYTFRLDEDGRSLLQPLASVMLNTISVKGYNESGADGAGLRVDDQTRTVTTLALGARWLTELDTDTFGKGAAVELSAAIAQDLGDTRSKADVSLLGNPGVTAGVRGAEAGSTSFRLGAGISLPITDHSQLFLNGNADLRSNSTLWNINLGLQIAF